MLVDFDVRGQCERCLLLLLLLLLLEELLDYELWTSILASNQGLKQSSQTQLLEGKGPAVFSFNPNETHLYTRVCDK